MVAVFCLFTLAAGFWFVIFSPWTNQLLPFWPSITAAASVLAVCALIFDRKRLSWLFQYRPNYIAAGLISAAILYAIFAAGHLVSTRIFSFAAPQISDIYINRQGTSPLAIGLLLFFLIGPAEEIFWRGFLQRRLCERVGRAAGFMLAVLLYTAVHIWSFNFMLIAAAFVCGAFWGLVFDRYRSLWPAIISHALWDVAVFVVFPLQ